MTFTRREMGVPFLQELKEVGLTPDCSSEMPFLVAGATPHWSPRPCSISDHSGTWKAAHS